jgi:hypothetical protein
VPRAALAPPPETDRGRPRWVAGDSKEDDMRGNSGGGEGENNNRNPTLRDAEREKGVSGAAVHGKTLSDSTPKRGSARKNSP